MKSPEKTQPGAETVDPVVAQLQQHFVTRLHQLIAKRQQQLKIDPTDKLSLRLLSRALYATYMDCVANGVGDQASDLLEKAQSQAPPPATKTA